MGSGLSNGLVREGCLQNLSCLSTFHIVNSRIPAYLLHAAVGVLVNLSGRSHVTDSCAIPILKIIHAITSALPRFMP